MKRTEAEIQDMIQKILAQKESVPERSFFGDPNHLIFDLQVEILQGKITDEDDIYDMGEDELDDVHKSTIIEAFDYLEGRIMSLVE